MSDFVSIWGYKLLFQSLVWSPIRSPEIFPILSPFSGDGKKRRNDKLSCNAKWFGESREKSRLQGNQTELLEMRTVPSSFSLFLTMTRCVQIGKLSFVCRLRWLHFNSSSSVKCSMKSKDFLQIMFPFSMAHTNSGLCRMSLNLV